MDFLDSVRGILADTGLCPANLTIELTESTVLRDADAAFATLGKLRATGVRVALDDFGTGYSSLSYLRQMPIDVLKVDRSFIDGALSDPRGQELASSIVEMAHKLGYTVVAEGIEVESQWSWLKSIGCTLGQGHMFLPAVPQHELSRYLAQSRSRQETRPVAA